MDSASEDIGRRREPLRLWQNKQKLLLLLSDVTIVLVLTLGWLPSQLGYTLAGMVLLLLTRWKFGLYRVRFHCSSLDEFPRGLAAGLLAGGAFGCMSYVFNWPITAEDVVREGAAGAVLALMRAPIYVLLRDLRRHDLVRQRMLLVGSGVIAEEISDLAKGDADYGLELVGQVPDLVETDLVEEAKREDAAVVLVAFSSAAEAQEVYQIRRGLAAGLQVMAVPRYFDLITEQHTDDSLFGVPVQELSGRRPRSELFAKRVFDIALATLALAFVAPVLAVVALPLKRETRADLFFRQRRIGKDGKPFELLKLQTMKPVEESTSNTAWTVDPSSRRLQPVGRFLRKTSLDELPQLWNILRGDMSFVGPRPERPFFVEKFSDEYPHYSQRHRMTVGLTGLAQINDLRGDTSIDDRARFDNLYADHWSLWGDLKIVLKTVPKVLKASGD